MYRTMTKFVVAVLVGALLVAACAPTATPISATAVPPTAAKEPIRIGISGQFSGPQTIQGDQTKQAAVMAEEEINAAGGVLGRPIKIYYEDNGCDPALGAPSVSRLIDVDKVAVILGDFCSGVTLTTMPIIESAGIVQLEVNATNPKITSQAGVGGNIWQFRLNIDDSIMAAYFSKAIAKEVKSIVIATSNDEFGRGAADAFSTNLAPLGVEILSIEYFTYGQADYRPIITKIRSENPEGILAIADFPDAAILATQMKEVGLTNLKIYGRGTVVSNSFVDLVKDPTIWDGAKEVNRWAPQGSDLEKRYEARWGMPLEIPGIFPYYAIYVVVEAIKIAGTDDRAAIREALTKVSMNIPELGPVSFDDHNQAHPDMFITQLQHGTVVTLERLSTAQ